MRQFELIVPIIDGITEIEAEYFAIESDDPVIADTSYGRLPLFSVPSR